MIAINLSFQVLALLDCVTLHQDDA
jgi:hypothetical protein